MGSHLIPLCHFDRMSECTRRPQWRNPIGNGSQRLNAGSAQVRDSFTQPYGLWSKYRVCLEVRCAQEPVTLSADDGEE